MENSLVSMNEENAVDVFGALKNVACIRFKFHEWNSNMNCKKTLHCKKGGLDSTAR